MATAVVEKRDSISGFTYVHGVASCTVDDGAVRHVLSVVNHHSPDVDEHEEGNVGELLQREHKGEEVVRNRLRVAVERVESVGCKGSRHDPLVVRLVETSVDHGVVKTTVDPVDAEVGKGDEEGELEYNVPAAHVPGRVCGESVVDEGVAANLCDEPGRCQKGNDGHCMEGLLDFHAHLVFEIFGMLDGGLVENENVGETGADKIVD